MFSADSLRIPASLQALAPAQARFCLAALRFIKRDLDLDLQGKSLLVGFSGGADSTALLLILHYLAPSLHLTLTAAHLDHGLRPSSAQEAEYCRAFCRGLDIACVHEAIDVAERRRKKSGVEEEGRAARYDFFTRTAAHLECDWIVTGHHNNDLAEDLLMRLIRGTGWPALSGMPAVDQKRRLLRPLLLTARKDIEDFLVSLGLAWLRDESNEDRAYLRNRVRLDLLPLILRENPAFLAAAAGLWRIGRIDERYFNSLLPDPRSAPGTIPCPARMSLRKANAGSAADPSPEADFSQAPDPFAGPDRDQSLIMPREQLAGLPKALRLRFYKKTLARLGPGQALLPALLALDRAWLAKNGKTTHHFPGGKTAVADNRGIVWKRTDPR